MRSATGAWCIVAFAVMPLAVPAVLAGVTARSASASRPPSSRRPLELPVIGAERAPNLMRWLRGQNVAVLPAPARCRTRRCARSATTSCCASTSSFADDWRASTPGAVELIFDSSRPLQAGTTIGARAEPARRVLGPARQPAPDRARHPSRRRQSPAGRPRATSRRPRRASTSRSSSCRTCCCCSRSSAACRSRSTRRPASANGSRSSRCSRRRRRAERSSAARSSRRPRLHWPRSR